MLLNKRGIIEAASTDTYIRQGEEWGGRHRFKGDHHGGDHWGERRHRRPSCDQKQRDKN